MLAMSGKAVKGGKSRGSLRTRALPLIGCALIGLAAAPALAGAISLGFDNVPVSLSARGGVGSFTPASIDQQLVSQLAAQIEGHKPGHVRLFRFTPAGMDNRPDRAVTVAVRVGEVGSQNLVVRTAVAGGSPGAAPIRIAPTVYNLGLARGYQSFAATPGFVRESPRMDIQRLEMPDLRAIGRSKDSFAASSASAPARLAPRIELDTRDRMGHAPRTFEGQADYQVDLGGSYSLTRNLDVTAGVRYSPERDRLRPLTDGKKDSQAVYVGTQFRF
ncbi:hypothetical protein AQZ52_01525 [Novosphingobium fuchskuhlense]|uniref:Porin domain-containing protein n=1 Tax=Novosphingobium fuchskuhlense TaxID=1117702 RepID=A0A117UZE9_9SPHN|nr:hypothetical protein [Novosphingobium fuchskuhlense]KUR73676.1 hypothetical protein AQZ52_01525 [Novosphingobium fuchskuhlense]